jgi:hypothetical protein
MQPLLNDKLAELAAQLMASLLIHGQFGQCTATPVFGIFATIRFAACMLKGQAC